jgi:hypothetical protein
MSMLPIVCSVYCAILELDELNRALLVTIAARELQGVAGYYVILCSAFSTKYNVVYSILRFSDASKVYSTALTN